MVVRDPAMQEAVRRAEQVAASEASVLIVGDTGTGKEVLARHIHRRSRRSAGPFVALNCSAIPDSLLESELFGHEKGAFSGAIARRIGKFEAADGGTLLLDEISEMDVRLQSKLPRAAGTRDRPIGQFGTCAGERAHPGHHQSRPAGRSVARHVSRGPVFSPQRGVAAHSAAARAARRHRGTG
jgi:transcriptional regulator with GAF, ATPase, and Fis domain